MIALVDTNVILDVLLKRQPHAAASANVLAAIERGRVTGLLGATTVTTIHFLVAKSLSEREAKDSVKPLLGIFDVAPVNRSVIESALESKLADFEDAVLEQAAKLAGADVIVTRNLRDFRNSKIPAYLPEDFLKLL